MSGKKVVVTGADSFIGAHLVERLVGLGYEVQGLVNFSYYHDIGALKYLPLYVRDRVHVKFGSITNMETTDRIVSDVNTVFHFCIGDLVAGSEDNLRDLVELNVLGTFNLLQSMKKHSVQRLIFISTSDVYGNNANEPKIKEDFPTNSLSPLIASHISAENFVEAYLSIGAIDVTNIRLFNSYGPRQSPSAIIPTIICQALTNTQIFLGSMYPVRDFIYITDAVSGIIKAKDRAIGKTINLASGIGVQIGDLAEMIVKLMGKEVEVVFDATRVPLKTQSIQNLVGDINKAKEFLDWQPKFSLDEGLKLVIEWFSEHPELVQGQGFS